ncbi:hypothetical protein FSP39_022761 [Pinctada imbricata]|uniref:Kinesin-like protein KIF3A n=1 Tax=Pinctada imbricata TaxID=66713 RepID=A0AA89BXX3_PINIB|nr:hypothetical protein FSP39_022761 [Pinctada imbricata]
MLFGPADFNISGLGKGTDQANTGTLFKLILLLEQFPDDFEGFSAITPLSYDVKILSLQEKSGPDGNDNVRVCVRCRPLNDTEKKQGCTQCVDVDEVRGTITVKSPNAGHGEVPKTFTFDNVFGMASKQVDVYNQVARPIVDFVLEGYNGTIFAYGQTGTGKTFTMEGVRAVPELRGVIPNSFAHIFGFIAKAEGDARFLVRVSYLEIYNEEVRDLLGKDQHARLEVKERPDVGVYVKDLSAYVVYNADDMDRIMTVGNKNRVTGATNMNLHSSRSHAIFTVTVECSEKYPDGKQHVRVGKLHLVDLAGSERQAKTGATGQRLKEATKINLSLSTLGNVISALVDGKSSHIPYRNSKLTRLLQDSLGGNSKTAMIANIGPADYNYDESISTLRYANRAKNIQNKAKINEDPKDALLRQYQKEIEELRKQLEEGSDYESGSEEESEEEVGEDGVVRRRKKKKKEHRRISKEKMAEIQLKIDHDRKMLEEKKDMAEEERNQVKQDLEEKEMELKKHHEEQEQLTNKLAALEKKIIVGGENLLEKAEEQERLLQESAVELEDRKKKEEKLRKALQEKEQERLDIEEKYNSLQDEIQGKTKKLKKVWTMLMQAKSEIADLQQEHQREMEGLLENVRQLSRELKLQMMVIDNYIPPEYQEMIEQNVAWNDDIGEWQLRCVAYSGNNMRKQSPQPDKDKDKLHEPDLSNVYLAYTAESAEKAMRPKTGKSGRPKSSRPKSSRPKRCQNQLLTNPSTKYTLTSSSEYASTDPTHVHGAARAVLNTLEVQDASGHTLAGGWSASTLDKNQYIQVEFPTLYTITGVSLQGRHGCCSQWVTKYIIQYSTDCKQWSSVANGKIFDGNKDEDTTVNTLLPSPVIVKCVRINPVAWHNHISLRFDLTGCPHTITSSAVSSSRTFIPGVTTSSSVLTTTATSKSQIILSTINLQPSLTNIIAQKSSATLTPVPSLTTTGGYIPTSALSHLASVHPRFSLATNSIVSTPIISASVTPTTNLQTSSVHTIYNTTFQTGMSSQQTTNLQTRASSIHTTNSPTLPTGTTSQHTTGNQAPHTTSCGNSCVTTTLAAPTNTTDICKNPLIKSAKLTASSEYGASDPNKDYGASRGYLDAKEEYDAKGHLLIGAWVAAKDDANQYLQAEFQSAHLIRGIITQGRHGCCHQWVSNYSVSYSYDCQHWHQFGGHNKTIFAGNFDEDTKVTNTLNCPIWAKCVRIHPLQWHNQISMRMELLGCPIRVPSQSTGVQLWIRTDLKPRINIKKMAALSFLPFVDKENASMANPQAGKARGLGIRGQGEKVFTSGTPSLTTPRRALGDVKNTILTGSSIKPTAQKKHKDSDLKPCNPFARDLGSETQFLGLNKRLNGVNKKKGIEINKKPTISQPATKKAPPPKKLEVFDDEREEMFIYEEPEGKLIFIVGCGGMGEWDVVGWVRWIGWEMFINEEPEGKLIFIVGCGGMGEVDRVGNVY